MKFKSIFAPEAEGMLKSTALFLIIVTGIFLLGGILSGILGGEYLVTSNIDMCSAIFLLVSGLVFFKESLHLGMANGVSRRTVYAGMLAVGLVGSVVVSLGNVLLTFVFSSNVGNEIMFQLGGGDNFFVRLVAAICLQMTFYTIGYFMAGCFYRLNKLGRTLFAAGVPVFLFVLLPIIIMTLPAAVQNAMTDFLNWLLTFIMTSAWNFDLILLAVTVLCAFFSWLLIRRAPMRT